MTVTHPPARLRMTPARWIALAIGLPIALSLIGFLGFDYVAQVGQATFPVSYAIPVPDGHASVGVGGGNVTVRPGGQGNSASLVGTVRYSLIRPDIVRTPYGVNLHCRFVFGDCEMNATLTVPVQDGVSLTTGGGDLTVSGLRGGVALSSGGGNISVSGVGGSVNASTGGGDISVDDLAGRLILTSDGGNINGTAITSPDVKVRTGGGDITLTFTTPPTHLDVTSDGGNVNVVLPPNGDRYAITYGTGGGNTNVQENIGNSESPYKVSVHTGGGDITIKESK
jgi:hypothetical protein